MCIFVQCLIILICDSNVINLFKISFFNCKSILYLYSSNFVVILIKYNSYFLILIFSGRQELYTLTFSVIFKFFILNIINVASFYYIISFDKTNWYEIFISLKSSTIKNLIRITIACTISLISSFIISHN